MPVLIGLSGWSYEDWVGRFYPVNLARKKEEWLRYYSSYFSTVEINSTFYRPPNEFLVNGWIKKGSGLKGFEYSVKMPSQVTHEALVRKEGTKAGVMATAFEETCVAPLARNKLLGAALLQLSPGFHNDEGSRRALEETLSMLDTEKYHYAVEFRHRSWLDDPGGLDHRTFEILSSRNVANVMVDGPGFPLVMESTADHGYVRLHGRNADIWSGEDREEDLRQSRYDYLYTHEEIEEWEERINQLKDRLSPLRVYFNNNEKAKGVKNALQLMDMLGIHHKEKDIPVQEQASLKGFLMAGR
ncbi:MAG: DUF72 domain-containing protein [Methanomassiliicoccus sp.]|nr:DUF72 domain-containing protein [Methanomassiliicoccus sp.]